MRHLIDFEDMTMDEWQDLYSLCCDIIKFPESFNNVCHSKVLGSLFFEPSTRTNFSFRAAMLRLGGNVIGFSDPGSSSVSKGESLKDTISMMSYYSDVLVMRSPVEGAAKAASLYARVPLINAGDGGHLHPTQTLADLTTIMQYRGSLDDIHIGLCGDLKNGRTVHSLIKALCRFSKIQFYLISPRELKIPDYIRTILNRSGNKYFEVTGLEPVIPILDVLYMTRIQRERFIDPLEYERLKGIYVLDMPKLKHAKEGLLIMHPLPRVNEIAEEVDSDPRAVYFEQARFGMLIRMALLYRLSYLPAESPQKVESCENVSCQNPKCITVSEKYLPYVVKEVSGARCCAYCDAEVKSK